MRSAQAGAWWFLLLPCAAVACVARPALRGPMPVRNQHPAQLTVLHLAPASAAVLPAGDVGLRGDLAYSSLFLQGADNGGSWRMDGEYLRSAAGFRVGLGGGLEFDAQVAVAHTTGGFLDNFVIDFHDAFGFPDQGRTASERNSYEIEARRGNQTVWSVDQTGGELLDLPMHLTLQLLPPATDRLGVAVRAGVELPTGDQRRGFGNGELDAGLGILLDYRTAGIGCYGHVEHSFAGTPDQARAGGLEFADVTSVGLGIELPLSEDIHALIQAEWETSTLRHLGPLVTSRDHLLLWVGGRWQPSPEWGVEVGFGEDLIGLVSPDFSAWLSVIWLP